MREGAPVLLVSDWLYVTVAERKRGEALAMERGPPRCDYFDAIRRYAIRATTVDTHTDHALDFIDLRGQGSSIMKASLQALTWFRMDTVLFGLMGECRHMG